jgi:SAM-dependent methyltransferase
MSIFSKLSRISRTRKLDLFDRIISPTKEMKLLDVGAQIDQNSNEKRQLIEAYPWKDNISVVNISVEHISTIKKTYPEIEAVVCDACELPWPDKHFDVVYSNAVIEHVGSFERQMKMASEIMRVGKRWFVTTPNRWFPFEFHMRLPIITWLPGRSYLRIGNIISYNHVQGKYMFGCKRDGLRLLSARELRKSFPDSDIIKQRVTFMAETLIVVGGDLTGKRAFDGQRGDSCKATKYNNC